MIRWVTLVLRPKRVSKRLSQGDVASDEYSIESERKQGVSHEAAENNQTDDKRVCRWGEALASGLSNFDGDKPNRE